MPLLTPVVGAAGRPLSFKQSDSGHVMIGGGHKGQADLDTGAIRLDVPRLAYSARTALDLFPALRGARIVHAWAGIEAVTPDELPVIGRSAVADGLVHAFGFSGHGFALAARRTGGARPRGVRTGPLHPRRPRPRDPLGPASAGRLMHP
jgi:sarcosine oxidase subunit beta